MEVWQCALTMPCETRFCIRISYDEKRLLMEAALRRGQTLSDLLRTSATEAAKRVAA